MDKKDIIIKTTPMEVVDNEATPPPETVTSGGETAGTSTAEDKPQTVIPGSTPTTGENLEKATQGPEPLQKKHLSGAQRRKLAIEKAVAKGEPIRLRKPRSNRRPKTSTVKEAEKPSTSRQLPDNPVKEAKTPRSFTC